MIKYRIWSADNKKKNDNGQKLVYQSEMMIIVVIMIGESGHLAKVQSERNISNRAKKYYCRIVTNIYPEPYFITSTATVL